MSYVVHDPTTLTHTSLTRADTPFAFRTAQNSAVLPSKFRAKDTNVSTFLHLSLFALPQNKSHSGALPTMNRFFAFLLLALLASNTGAFIVSPKHALLSTSSSPTARTMSPFVPMTILHLKVKVKEEDLKDDKLNPAVFKNAAYLGSILIALLLPLFFLLAK